MGKVNGMDRTPAETVKDLTVNSNEVIRPEMFYE